MKKDQEEILNLLEKEVEQYPLSSYLFENCVEKYSLLVSGVGFVFMIFLLLLEPLKVFAYAAGALFIVGILSYLAAQVVGALILFRSPLKLYVKRLKTRLPAQMEFIDKLGDYEPDALRETAGVIAEDIERIGRRVSLLIGLIEKIGIIPAGLALYYATYKHFYTEQSGQLADMVLASVCGLYIGAFLLHKLIESLRARIVWLEKAAEISEVRKKIKVA